MRAANESRPAGNGAASDQGADGGSIVSSLPRPSDIPHASCSVYAQVGGRELLQAAATCPQCHGVTVHRLAGPAVDGVAKLGACGHRYVLRPRRVYTPRLAAS